MRLRHRPDRFTWRENSVPFHRLQDGPTLSRLDPYCAGEQAWLLHCGRVINVTAAEVRDIAKQVNDQDLPDTRPAGDWDEARIKSIEERLAALEGQLPIQDQNDAVDEIVDEPELFETEDDINATQALQAELDETREALTIEQQKSAAAEARIAELEAQKPETPPLDSLGEELERTRRANRQLVNGAEEAKQPIPEEIAALMEEGETLPQARRRLTELLFVEQAELKNLRGMAGEDLPREAQIEKLLGLFARLGEI